MDQDFKQSQYRLRKAIGVLGLSLPVLLLLNHHELLASMSHYYYSSASIFFIGILSSFGLILFSYKGYRKEDDEFMSDDLATTLAAVFVFLTVLIPTKCSGSLGEINFCEDGYLFGHRASVIKNSIHLISAGLFISLLGYMCYAKFPMSGEKIRFYKTCGIIVWVCVGLLIATFIIDSFLPKDGKLETYIPAYTFWLETIAVWAFAIAWLVKGRIQNNFTQKKKD